MKKNYYYQFCSILLLFLSVSCATEKIDPEEYKSTYNPDAVWVYDGPDTVIKKVILELQKGPNKESLERRLLKNEVLWKNAEYLVIEGKKRILIPFLSIDKENIIGFLTLYRDSKGTTQYDMTVRSDLYSKKSNLPFWSADIWSGYFAAYDRTILGKKNGNPGIMRSKNEFIAKDASTSKTVGLDSICYNTPYRNCVKIIVGCVSTDGEQAPPTCVGAEVEHCESVYVKECYYILVPDNPNTPPLPNPGEYPDPTTGGPIYFYGFQFQNFRSLEDFIGGSFTYDINLPLTQEPDIFYGNSRMNDVTNGNINFLSYFTVSFAAKQILKSQNFDYDLRDFTSVLSSPAGDAQWAHDIFSYEVIGNYSYIDFFGDLTVRAYTMDKESAYPPFLTKQHFKVQIDIRTGEIIEVKFIPKTFH